MAKFSFHIIFDRHVLTNLQISTHKNYGYFPNNFTNITKVNMVDTWERWISIFTFWIAKSHRFFIDIRKLIDKASNLF